MQPLGCGTQVVHIRAGDSASGVKRSFPCVKR
ncbi:hypothetical protein A2U01_0117125, partial [Trifolium medium]|nr:hypothetical protein [Trifolium medium]